MWVQGSLRGRRVKKTLSLRNWEAAQKLVWDWESGNRVGNQNVSEARDAFLEDCEVRGPAGETTIQYGSLTEEMKSEFGSPSVVSVGIEDLRRGRGVETRAKDLPQETGAPADVLPVLRGGGVDYW